MVKLSFNFRSGDHASSDSETADSWDNSDSSVSLMMTIGVKKK